jgi:cytochrome c553
MCMFDKSVITRAAALVLMAALVLPASAFAKGDKDDKAEKSAAPAVQLSIEEKDVAVQQIQKAKLSKDGVNTCISCHDAENEYPVFPFFKSKHAVVTDPRSQSSQLKPPPTRSASVMW